MKIFSKNKGFTRLVDFGDAISSRTKSASPKFTTGFMVVEVLVAASIITASILAAMAVVQKSVYVARQALHTTQASFLLEEGAENTRIARDNAWANVINSSSSIGIFTRTVVASSVNRDNLTKDITTTETFSNDSRTKLITVTVSWPEGGVTITKTLQFYITDLFS